MIDIHLQLNTPVKQKMISTLNQQEISVLLGASGMGKSSLLNAIAGIIPAKGHIYLSKDPINILPIKIHKRPIAYVLQTPVLFNHLPIKALIKLISKQQISPYNIDWALAPLGLSTMLNSYAHELSGGQQKRLAILLSMIKKAPLLLLDEVFNGLDVVNMQLCQKIIKRYTTEVNASVIMTTHRKEEIIGFADSVFIANKLPTTMEWLKMPLEAGLTYYQNLLVNNNFQI